MFLLYAGARAAAAAAAGLVRVLPLLLPLLPLQLLLPHCALFYIARFTQCIGRKKTHNLFSLSFFSSFFPSFQASYIRAKLRVGFWGARSVCPFVCSQFFKLANIIQPSVWQVVVAVVPAHSLYQLAN